MRRFLAAVLTLLLATSCVRYAYRTAAPSYVEPEVLAQQAAQAGDKPVVLLIPGSMIVGAFYDPLRDWLTERGYAPIVYQPPELFTEPIKRGAERVAEAVAAVQQASGQERIFVIAECDGGIATRYYVEKMGGHERISRFISFVSAHNGTTGFPLAWFPALRDIDPASELVWEMRHSRLPARADTLVASVYFCGDEVMKPHSTSAYPGAINIEICDPALAERAAQREPLQVNHGLGQSMIPRYPIHFAGFWDEQVFALYQTILEGAEADIRGFQGLSMTVTD